MLKQRIIENCYNPLLIGAGGQKYLFLNDFENRLKAPIAYLYMGLSRLYLIIKSFRCV